MNTYSCLVTYAKPCHQGGVTSVEKEIVVGAKDEDEAEKLAVIRLHDNRCKWIIMVECSLVGTAEIEKDYNAVMEDILRRRPK
jgi:hypothetical protein